MHFHCLTLPTSPSWQQHPIQTPPTHIQSYSGSPTTPGKVHLKNKVENLREINSFFYNKMTAFVWYFVKLFYLLIWIIDSAYPSVRTPPPSSPSPLTCSSLAYTSHTHICSKYCTPYSNSNKNIVDNFQRCFGCHKTSVWEIAKERLIVFACVYFLPCNFSQSLGNNVSYDSLYS